MSVGGEGVSTGGLSYAHGGAVGGGSGGVDGEDVGRVKRNAIYLTIH